MIFSQLTFKNPEFFFLMVPLLLLFWRLNKKAKPSLMVSSIDSFKLAVTGWRHRLAQALPWVELLAGSLIVVALARPQTATEKIKRNVDGIDIVIALDISDSMLIEDIQPSNRLEAAKEIITKFIRGRSSDRIGVVIFAGEAFTLIPLTLDYDLIISRVADIQTARNARIKDGTALGVALASAAGRLRESTAQSRVIIFLTDGENNSGLIDPATGLEIAKGYGHKIYSIGLGKSGPTRLPIYTKDIFGNKLKTYQPFESYVNDELLTQMANETGGKYYKAETGIELGSVFNEIDQLEKTKIDENKYTQYKEEFPKYLTWAFFILFASILIKATLLRRGPL